MNLKNLTYQGPQIDDAQTLEDLPNDYQVLLRQINGFVQFGNGLHIRGVCKQPAWHSITTVWTGTLALSHLYPNIRADDIPFGQDAFGDQFFLRHDFVHRLYGETGETESLHCRLSAFLESVQADPIGYLGLEPLIRFNNEGGALELGQLLNVYPPFCTKESELGVSLKAISFDERIKFLANFASKIAAIDDGEKVGVTVKA